MYTIEPVFILFPLLCLIAGNTKHHSKKQTIITFFVFYVFLYVFSLNGADIDTYRGIYYEKGIVFRHGEFMYYAVSTFLMKIGVPYYVFRILLLATCSVVLFYSVWKLSDNFLLSCFFLLSMFLVYMISAYRQFIVMSFSLFWFWQYFKGKKVLPIVGVAFLMMFHFTAIVPLLFIVLYDIAVKRDMIGKILAFGHKRIFILLILSFLIRIVLFFLLNDTFLQSVSNSYDVSFLGKSSFVYPGLLSRICFLVLIAYLYYSSQPKEKSLQFLYWYYCLGMLLYIAVPLELFMGRMLNNANIACVILIPNLIYRVLPESFNTIAVIREKRLAGLAYLLLEIGAVVILLAQLLRQNGYTPYSNILFHLEYLLQ